MRVQDWAIVGLLALVLLPGMAILAEVWAASPYYSYGFFIPFVALWAASSKRRVLPLLDSGWDLRGAWLLSGALLSYLLGWLGGATTWVGVSMVAAVAGGVWLIRGRQWLKTLMFPIAYLLFMVPIPDAWLTTLTGPLQLWVSEFGTTLLRFMGEPVLRRGNIIELPGGVELFVAEACSGITSLLTLLPLGTILAYFTERRQVRRVLMILSVIPVALLGNLVRVLLTVELAQRVGVAAATESAIHDWVGVGTYVSACGVMLGIGALFRRWDRFSTEPDLAS
ncbi:MAG: exosortase/archaeosortase family protein [Myxococcota bacterium]|nr:exosortase/archaeosortase family protein [Myxococcota bacterium]